MPLRGEDYPGLKALWDNPDDDVYDTWEPIAQSAPVPIHAPSPSPASHEHDWLDVACVFTAPGKSTPFRGCVCGAKKWGDQVLVPAAENTNWRKDTPG